MSQRISICGLHTRVEKLCEQAETQEGLRALNGFVNALRYELHLNYPQTFQLFRDSVGMEEPEFEQLMAELDENFE